MAKFRVLVERARYTPFFKVFEAETMDEAEQAATDEIDRMTLQQDLPDLGWGEGDDSVEYGVQAGESEVL